MMVMYEQGQIRTIRYYNIWLKFWDYLCGKSMSLIAISQIVGSWLNLTGKYQRNYQKDSATPMNRGLP